MAVFALAAAAAYSFVGYFLLGAALKLASGAPYRLARHVVAYAAAPLALGLLVLWPVRAAVHGSDLFRAGGADGGAGGTVFRAGRARVRAVGGRVARCGDPVRARYSPGLGPWPSAVLPVTLAGLAVWLDRF